MRCRARARSPTARGQCSSPRAAALTEVAVPSWARIGSSVSGSGVIGRASIVDITSLPRLLEISTWHRHRATRGSSRPNAGKAGCAKALAIEKSLQIAGSGSIPPEQASILRTAAQAEANDETLIADYVARERDA